MLPNLTKSMKLYSQLSKISFLKNRYVAKFLFVAFLGIHIPLIGLVFLVVYLDHQLSPINIFLITLFLTLVASAVTLSILKKLLEPVLKGSDALTHYRLNQTVPRLPLNYTDEAGTMLQNIQATIQMNQKLVTEKKDLFQLLTNELRIQTEHTGSIIANILDETEKDSVKKMASSAAKSMNQQLNFVDTFIELEKQEALLNAEEVKVRKVNMESVFSEVKRKFKSKLEAKNIEFIIDNNIQDVRVKVNRKLLNQAVEYLVDNAIKFSTDASKIEVSIQKERGRLLIYLRDHGIGFEPNQANQVFTKFNAVFDEKDEYVPGIELNIARKIIERFGGTIIAESGGKNKGVVLSIEMKLYK